MSRQHRGISRRLVLAGVAIVVVAGTIVAAPGSSQTDCGTILGEVAAERAVLDAAQAEGGLTLAQMNLMANQRALLDRAATDCGTATVTTTSPATTSGGTATTAPPAPATTSATAATTTTSPPAPVAGTSMPTSASTGPTVWPTDSMTAAQFIASGSCANAVIVDQVRVDQFNLPGVPGRWSGTMDNCVLRQGFYWDVDAPYGSASDYPALTMTRTDIQGSMVMVSPLRLTMDDVEVTHGGFWAPCGTCAASNFGLVIPMPVVVRNSLFHHPVGSPPDHTEALHVAGSGQGYSFVNTRFVQDGPMNGTQTAALFFHGGGSTFNGCWFDDGEASNSDAFYFAIYIYGLGTGAHSNVVSNSVIESGKAGYVYPGNDGDPVVQASYSNNRDLHSGMALQLP